LSRRGAGTRGCCFLADAICVWPTDGIFPARRRAWLDALGSTPFWQPFIDMAWPCHVLITSTAFGFARLSRQHVRRQPPIECVPFVLPTHTLSPLLTDVLSRSSSRPGRMNSTNQRRVLLDQRRLDGLTRAQVHTRSQKDAQQQQQQQPPQRRSWRALACVGLRWLTLARVGSRWLALARVGSRCWSPKRQDSPVHFLRAIEIPEKRHCAPLSLSFALSLALFRSPACSLSLFLSLSFRSASCLNQLWTLG